MILLALETTDIRASVALYRNGAVKEKCIENILIMGYFGKVFKRVLTKYFSVVKIFIFHVLIL